VAIILLPIWSHQLPHYSWRSVTSFPGDPATWYDRKDQIERGGADQRLGHTIAIRSRQYIRYLWRLT